MGIGFFIKIKMQDYDKNTMANNGLIIMLKKNEKLVNRICQQG